MNAAILKRWTGLGISIGAALFIFLLTQTLMQASAQGDGKLPGSQEEQGTAEEEAGFRERDRFLSGQTFPLAEVTLPERVAPEGPQNTSLLYIENVGQFDDQARFQLRGGQGTIHFANDAVWITLLEPAQDIDSNCRLGVALQPDCDLYTSSEDGQISVERDTNPPSRRGVHLKLSFVGANPRPNIVGFNPLPTTISYFMGNEPAGWRPDVPVYGGIRYEGVYPDIDVEYTSKNGVWYPRIIAQPQANLAAVELRVEGAKSQSITEDGHLRLETDIGVVTLPLFNLANSEPDRLSKPELRGQTISKPFYFGNFSSPPPPFGIAGLAYSTFLGGISSEDSEGIAVDSSGAAYVTGETLSTDFPTTSGVYSDTYQGSRDIFVSKLDANGTSLIYSTYIGHTDEERVGSIAVDGNGNAYIAGRTKSSGFPTTSGTYSDTHQGGDDVFVTKLNSTGTSLIYSTFLGSSGNDRANDIAIDSTGAAYITGETLSSNFPTTTGAFSTTYGTNGDAFVTKLNPTGTDLDYSTFLGGEETEIAWAIAVDSSGKAFVTGSTNSENFPTTPGAWDVTYATNLFQYHDVFVTKVNASGSDLDYSTFIGGTGHDGGFDIAIDFTGAAYVTGIADNGFPKTPGAYDTTQNGFEDAFVTKISPTGSSLIYSTFLGGTSDESGHSIMVDELGVVYVTGDTELNFGTIPFPTTTNAYDPSYNGNADAFVAKLNTTGNSLLYSSFLGGSGDEGGVALAIDSAGAIYVTGGTSSSDFPTTTLAYDTVISGTSDVFVTKFPALPIYESMEWNIECPFCNVNNTQGVQEGIHPRSGSFVYGDRQFSIPLLGGGLNFDYSYISAGTDIYTTTMG